MQTIVCAKMSTHFINVLNHTGLEGFYIWNSAAFRWLFAKAFCLQVSAVYLQLSAVCLQLSAVYLHFQLFVYNNQLFIYIFSCLFTIISWLYTFFRHMHYKFHAFHIYLYSVICRNQCGKRNKTELWWHCKIICTCLGRLRETKTNIYLVTLLPEMQPRTQNDTYH